MTLFGLYVDQQTLWAIAGLLLAAPVAVAQSKLWKLIKAARLPRVTANQMAYRSWQPAHERSWRDIPVGRR